MIAQNQRGSLSHSLSVCVRVYFITRCKHFWPTTQHVHITCENEIIVQTNLLIADEEIFRIEK